MTAFSVKLILTVLSLAGLLELALLFIFGAILHYLENQAATKTVR